MAAIRIISTPPGFAPVQIRACWVGVTIPLATEEEIAEDPPSGTGIGNENEDGYLVLRHKAIEALMESGLHDAAHFWNSFPLGRYLEFKKDVCELV